MSEDSDSEDALVLATALLNDWDKRKVNPVIAYAAIGCAFQMLQQGLGKDKKEWLETTSEMGELTKWEKNDA